MNKKDLRIVFMGTPDFAVETLRILIENKKNVVAVVTAPDKPAGRGKKIRTSAVKDFAEQHNLKILQPTNLKSADFDEELSRLQADLQIVVAFRMLPETVWSKPELGTFNLHASLLPKYRGAAPINRAIMNGEKETGLTTFFLQKEIDTGDIIFQKKIAIGADETAGELHDRMMVAGAELVLNTVEAIENGEIKSVPQEHFMDLNAKMPDAPKIFKEDCKINWNRPMEEVYNFIRGLSPYPAAWTELKKEGEDKKINLKIFRTEILPGKNDNSSPEWKTEDKQIEVIFPEGELIVNELQLAGKKKMTSKELLNGTDLSNYRLVL